MFDDLGEITTMIAQKETELEGLRTRMDDDFDLWALVPYEPKDEAGNTRKGYASYTSSAPKNFFGKTLDGLNRAQMSIQIKLAEAANEKERKAASNGELFLLGGLHEVDRRQAQRGEPPLRQAMGFLECMRGWIALRALVYVPKGKTETVFDVRLWDMMHVTWESGPDGLIWAAYKRLATKAQIKAEFDITISGKEETVTDFWDVDGNSIIIGKEWGKEPTEHNIGHVPCFIGSVGSMPTLQARMSGNANGNSTNGTIEYRGDSVWSASRGLYEPFNSQVSTLMDIHRRAATGSVKFKSPGGTKTIEGDPWRTFTVIPMDLQDELEFLALPQAPPETAAILTLIDDDLQKSTLPYPLAYGGTREAMSGRALAYLGDQTKSVYSPRTGTQEQAYTWMCGEFLSQFKSKGNKPTEMRGYDQSGQFFQVKMKPNDINQAWYVEVKVEPRMPRDMEQEIMMSLAATQDRPGTGPLVSLGTAREEFMLMRDPDAEETKIMIERGKNMPPIQMARIANAVKESGDDEGADLIVSWGQSQGMGGPPPEQSGTTQPSEVVSGQGTSPATGPGPSSGDPPEVQVIQAVLQALQAMGAEPLAQALAQAMDSGQPPPLELVRAVMEALQSSGQQDLAGAFIQVLQQMAGGAR